MFLFPYDTKQFDSLLSCVCSVASGGFDGEAEDNWRQLFYSYVRISGKSFTLFITLKTITKLDLGDKFAIKI